MDPLRPPISFAHRGARAERRENTLDAFRRALELGATGLESDAWLTADGIVVLDHDGVVGPPWSRRPIAALARAALPAHIPALGDLYAACGIEYQLSLDLKDPDALVPVLAAAAAAGPEAPGRLWICHHAPADLLRGHPDAAVAHLVDSTRLARLAEGLPARIDHLAANGVAALNLPAGDWTEPGVATVHAAGVLAFGWDAQSRPAIRRLLDCGADGIYSDHVGRLVDEVTKRPAMPGSEAAEARQGPDHNEGAAHD